jgi:hypothetical protein
MIRVSRRINDLFGFGTGVLVASVTFTAPEPSCNGIPEGDALQAPSTQLDAKGRLGGKTSWPVARTGRGTLPVTFNQKPPATRGRGNRQLRREPFHGAQRPFRPLCGGSRSSWPGRARDPSSCSSYPPTRQGHLGSGRPIAAGRKPSPSPKNCTTSRRFPMPDPWPRTRDLLTLHRHSFTRCNRACGLNNPFIFIIAR